MTLQSPGYRHCNRRVPRRSRGKANGSEIMDAVLRLGSVPRVGIGRGRERRKKRVAVIESDLRDRA